MRAFLFAVAFLFAFATQPAKSEPSTKTMVIVGVAAGSTVFGSLGSAAAGVGHIAGYGEEVRAACNGLGNVWHGPTETGSRYQTMGECVGWRTGFLSWLIGRQPTIQPVE